MHAKLFKLKRFNLRTYLTLLCSLVGNLPLYVNMELPQGTEAGNYGLVDAENLTKRM